MVSPLVQQVSTDEAGTAVADSHVRRRRRNRRVTGSSTRAWGLVLWCGTLTSAFVVPTPSWRHSASARVVARFGTDVSRVSAVSASTEPVAADYAAELDTLIATLRSSNQQESMAPMAMIQAAMDVFDRMFQAYLDDDEAVDDIDNHDDVEGDTESTDPLLPDVAIYNQLLQVHALAAQRADMTTVQAIVTTAHTMVQRMQDPSNVLAPTPDVTTYATLMDLYLTSRRYTDVVALYEQQTAHADDTVLVNKVVQAYARHGNVANAMALLDTIAVDQHTVQWTTWIQLLRAHAQHGDTVAVHALVERMASLDYNVQATAVQNAMLQAMVHAHDPSPTLCKDAEAMLYRMMATDTESSTDSANEEGDDDTPSTGPNDETFHLVLQSYRRVKDTAGCAFKMEQLLSLQDALAQPHSSRDTASARTLSAALRVMARDRTDVKKATKAQRVWDRLLRDHASTASLVVQYQALSSVLNACASTPKMASPAEKLAAFTIAMECFNRALEYQTSMDLTSRLDPSSVYGQFLTACHTLVPASNPKRDALVQTAFDACCAAGHVNAYVLEQFARVASDELVLKLVGGFLEDGVEPPAAWSVNVRPGGGGGGSAMETDETA